MAWAVRWVIIKWRGARRGYTREGGFYFVIGKNVTLEVPGPSLQL